MLKIKKICSFIAVIFAAVCAFSQSGTATLTKRYLEKANTQFEAAQYDEAYKTINAVLKLNENTGIPANAALIATQIYSKLLDEVKEKRTIQDLLELPKTLKNTRLWRIPPFSRR